MSMRYAILSVCLIVAGCAAAGDSSSVSDDVVRQSNSLLKAAGSAQKEIVIASLPYADCSLSTEAANESPEITADDEGLVHLWAAPQDVSKVFTLACDESGEHVEHIFDLSDSRTFVPDQPRVKSKDRIVVPPLVNPETISQAEITARGYPPRPADDGSGQYARWLELVSKPMTVANPRLVERPSRHHDPATSDTDDRWAGLALHYVPDTYTNVYSTFTVPTAYNTTYWGSVASVWIGLGGGDYDADDGYNLIQEGVDAYGYYGVVWNAPWYEYNGDEPTVYPSFTMNAGDVVYWDTWECDQNMNYGPNSHGWACYFWYDQTRNMAITTQKLQQVAPHPFVGRICEAIVERGSEGMDYGMSGWNGAIQIPFNCQDYGTRNTWDVTTDPYYNITMKNSSGQTLAHASKSSPNIANIYFSQAL